MSRIAASSFATTAGPGRYAALLSRSAASAFSTTCASLSPTSRSTAPTSRALLSTSISGSSFATANTAFRRTYGCTSSSAVLISGTVYSSSDRSPNEPSARTATPRTSGLGSAQSFASVFIASTVMSACFRPYSHRNM